MAAPRKIFRIEQIAAARIEHNLEPSAAALRHAEIVREIIALRALLAGDAPVDAPGTAAPQPHGADRLTCELNLIAGAIGGDGTDGANNGKASAQTESSIAAGSAPLTRLAYELNAVVNGTEQATQKILAAAEEIDQVANNLSAALDGKIEQGCAQDIQDLVIKIFEACNFQDLVGQRVGKVLTTLQFVESHIARVLDEIKTAASTARRDGIQALHGPRLDDDRGHASQREIDALFAGRQ